MHHGALYKLSVLGCVFMMFGCGRRIQTSQPNTMPSMDMASDTPVDANVDVDITSDMMLDDQGDQGNRPVLSAGCGQATAYTPGQTSPQSLTIDGRSRTWRVRLPAGYDASTPAPVLFVLHGGFGSGEQVETNQTNFNPIGAREGIILVYPDGIPRFPNASGAAKIRTWNAGGCCGEAAASSVDDVAFILGVLKTIEQNACVDRRRVYSTGMSNGAMMSYRLACDAAPYFAGIAPVAGSLVHAPCTPSQPIPLLHIHGRLDKNVPLTGGDGCGSGDLSKSIALADIVEKWSALHQCQSDSRVVLQRPDVTCTAPSGCIDAVNVCVLDSGDHSWPGGVPRATEPRGDCAGGVQVQTFNASERIWSFLSAQALDAVVAE